MEYTYVILLRDSPHGARYDLTFFCDGDEVGGAVFPVEVGFLDRREGEALAYEEALSVGEDWLSSRLVF